MMRLDSGLYRDVYRGWRLEAVFEQRGRWGVRLNGQTLAHAETKAAAEASGRRMIDEMEAEEAVRHEFQD